MGACLLWNLTLDFFLWSLPPLQPHTGYIFSGTYFLWTIHRVHISGFTCSGTIYQLWIETAHSCLFKFSSSSSSCFFLGLGNGKHLPPLKSPPDTYFRLPPPLNHPPDTYFRLLPPLELSINKNGSIWSIQSNTSCFFFWKMFGWYIFIFSYLAFFEKMFIWAFLAFSCVKFWPLLTKCQMNFFTTISWLQFMAFPVSIHPFSIG